MSTGKMALGFTRQLPQSPFFPSISLQVIERLAGDKRPVERSNGRMNGRLSCDATPRLVE